MPFYWTEFHQKAFEQDKELFIKPPVLHLPRPGGRLILYCDTSKTHTGSSLWQMQDGKHRLLGYASKSLPDACKNYSVTELEMTGLVINIHLWKHLLFRVEFDCAVDHRALPYIMKSKNFYMAVGMNKMPSKARTARKLESDLMNAVYMIHGGLLYRYMRNSTGDSEPVLCVPASKIDIFLELFSFIYTRWTHGYV